MITLDRYYKLQEEGKYCYPLCVSFVNEEMGLEYNVEFKGYPFEGIAPICETDKGEEIETESFKSFVEGMDSVFSNHLDISFDIDGDPYDEYEWEYYNSLEYDSLSYGLYSSVKYELLDLLKDRINDMAYREDYIALNDCIEELDSVMAGFFEELHNTWIDFSGYSLIKDVNGVIWDIEIDNLETIGDGKYRTADGLIIEEAE